jgi:hypothetical protein
MTIRFFLAWAATLFVVGSAHAQAVRIITTTPPPNMTLVQPTQNISCATTCESMGSWRGQCELWKAKNCKK